ncbi:hypothetical protein P0D75_39165 [Paraburkholderia sediminicola]|jgi:hypothetical protein|uniref:hypothetical protein n=1 Tax=Paraburkholderia TaxID=1822464 RepID=UPI00131D8489
MPSGLGPHEGRRSAMRDDASWAATVMWARGVGKQLTGGRPRCLEPPVIGCGDRCRTSLAWRSCLRRWLPPGKSMKPLTRAALNTIVKGIFLGAAELNGQRMTVHANGE